MAPSELDLLFSFHRYRKLRLYFAWPFVIALAVFAKSTEQGFWLGAPVIVLGEAIRVWSHGYLRKARQLAMDGPYAYVRNPLYIGNFLIGFGFCIIIWNPIIVSIFTLGFAIVYGVTIKGEEQRLSYKFKEEYERYRQKVPRLFPRLTPCGGRRNAKFKIHRVWGHGEPITILAILGLFLILYLRHELYQERAMLSGFVFMVLISTLLVGLPLLSALYFRGSKGKRFKRRAAGAG